MDGHRGYHQRGYLHHLDLPATEQFITYRLADALPADVVAELKRAALPRAAARRRAELLLDRGHGACVLRRREVAAVVVDNWKYFDPRRYSLREWVVMPNHVHVLIEVVEGVSLSRIVHSWKSFTAKRILERIDEGERARFAAGIWYEDYWDRAIRGARHRDAVVAYIRDNPVRAGLARSAEAWPFGSAHRR